MEEETRQHLSIFPPINHEDLPIPPPPQPPPPHAPLRQPPRPPHAPPCIDTVDHPSPPLKQSHLKNCTQLVKWCNFALHFWNSKFASFCSKVTSFGLFSSLWNLVCTASFVGFVWFWFRRRKRRRISVGCDGGESVEQLRAIIKDKDEKILQLLEQIAQMNKLLLARCRIPVLKPS